jgi:hypothetical protein
MEAKIGTAKKKASKADRTFDEKVRDSNMEGRRDFDPLGGALNTAIEDLRVAAYAVEMQEEGQPVRQEIVGVLLRAIERVEAVRGELHRQRLASMPALTAVGAS